MVWQSRVGRGLLSGLSGRLLLLTALFVMLAEVLVFVPSIARFRIDYLENQIAKAHLAALAVEAAPNNAVTVALEKAILFHADAYAVVLKLPDRRMLMLGEKLPQKVDVTDDLREASIPSMIAGAFSTLLQDDNRVMRVIGSSPREPDATIEVLLDETPMRTAMYRYAGRILVLSVVISLFAAGLVYLTLQWLLVRPIRRLTSAMLRFRYDPEDEGSSIASTDRRDEIGVAEHTLAEMQRDVRGALRQKTRLAALGSAMAKINHDLRNTLATALLISDRLATLHDPEARRLAPKLCEAIDRAVDLCRRTLAFAREEQPPFAESTFTLRALMAEVVDATPVRAGGPPLALAWQVRGDAEIDGDRGQLFRVFANLAVNAAEAGARTLTVSADETGGCVGFDLTDDGPGIPAKVLDRLFQPFAASRRESGNGLGLVIAREIAQAHGGDLVLVATGREGTVLRVELPWRRVRWLAPPQPLASIAEAGRKWPARRG